MHFGTDLLRCRERHGKQLRIHARNNPLFELREGVETFRDTNDLKSNDTKDCNEERVGNFTKLKCSHRKEVVSAMQQVKKRINKCLALLVGEKVEILDDYQSWCAIFFAAAEEYTKVFQHCVHVTILIHS